MTKLSPATSFDILSNPQAARLFLLLSWRICESSPGHSEVDAAPDQQERTEISQHSRPMGAGSGVWKTCTARACAPRCSPNPASGWATFRLVENVSDLHEKAIQRQPSGLGMDRTGVTVFLTRLASYNGYPCAYMRIYD